MAAEEERLPIYALALGPSEYGRYDSDGVVRRQVRKRSAGEIISFAFQEGHAPDEIDEALNDLTNALRKARRLRRQQLAENSKE
jgi:hypothetical protein